MPAQSVFFIDSRVADRDALIAGLPSASAWFLLDAKRCGVEQMAALLTGYRELGAIQIVSHGSAGTLYLGSTVLDAGNLDAYADQLRLIGSSLSSSGDILLYGCSVAAGDEGAWFIASLADAIGADVAASVDLTGSAALGGDWQLERATGPVDSHAISAIAYGFTLDVINGDPADNLLPGTAGADLINGLGGRDTLNGLEGDDTLDGGAGDDTLDGGGGIDSLVGGSGNDLFIVDDAGDLITETSALDAEIDTVQSSVSYTLGATWVENLTLTGVAAIDGTGNGLANLLTGNGAANRLDGGAGSDTLVGGLGNDTYVIDSITDTVTEAAAGGIDGIQSTVSFSLAVAAEVENLTLTGAASTNATGNALANILTGNGAANLLDGGAGIDTLVGGSGNDTYVVDSTTDTITELVAGGTDTVQSSVAFSLALIAEVENLMLNGVTAIDATGNALANSLTGNAAANLLDGGGGVDTLAGGLGNDTYVVDDAGDVIAEASALDAEIDAVQSSVSYTLGATYVENLTLTGATAINGTGNALSNVVTGNGAANVLEGGAGIDTLVGGLGSDTYVVDSITDTLIEAAAGGTDTVRSSVGLSLALIAEVENLTLTGAVAVNATGNALANVLTGNASANVLDGGSGADTLIGGLGNDTYVVDSAADTVTEASGSGTDTVQSSVTFSLALLPDVENLTLTGFAAINGAGNALANILTGNGAANLLDGGGGVDSLVGGLGNDIYVVDNSGDVITETSALDAEIDTVQSSVSYVLGSTWVENLTLTGVAATNGTGNALANMLTGNGAANVLEGGSGIDTLIGGLGNDVYVVDSTTDTLIEAVASGIDTVRSSVGLSLAVIAEVENLTLTGAASINATGNTLANILTGNAGANLLDGGAGIDTLIGGLGNDTYVVDSITDTLIEAAAGGTDAVQASVTFSLAALEAVENLVLSGVAVINGTGNALANTLTGNGAPNQLDGGGGVDSLIGGLGNDVYVVDNPGDVITETSALDAEIDTVQTSVSYTLGVTYVEQLTLTGVAAISGTGNALANVLSGNGAANVLDGGAGIDTLIGGLGSDTYLVDSTTDTVIEAAAGGIDTVRSSVSFSLALIAEVENLTLTGVAATNGTGNALANTLVGNSAVNVLEGGAGIDTLIGGTGNDTYAVDSTTDTLAEAPGGGTDTVLAGVSFSLAGIAEVENLTLSGAAAINGTGNGLANVLTGNAAANVLDGGSGADTLIGGPGNDIYVVDSTADVVTEAEDEGVDEVRSSVSFNLAVIARVEKLTLTGVAAINGSGNALANILTGNAAANVLDGGDGVDTLVGGLGNDTYVVDSTMDTLTEAAAGGRDTVLSSVSFSLASIAEVENLTLGGVSAIDGTGNALANVLTGNSAANVLNGGSGVDTLAGGLGNDTYLVDDAGDVISEISGLAAEIDTVQSVVSYVLGATFVENLMLSGAAAISGGGNEVANRLTGNDAANRLDGGGGSDTLIGGLGNDTLDGGAGSDLLEGGKGSDTYMVGAGDLLNENPGEGTDTVISDAGRTLGNHLERLVLSGTLDLNGAGNTLANVLTGNDGNNDLSGREGNDTLQGGNGSDTLSGGSGADAFVFNTALSASNVDVVTDFTHLSDRLRLDDDVFTQFAAGVAIKAAQFYKAAGASAARDADDRIVYDTANGKLYYDADGSGDEFGAVQFAQLSNSPALTVADFLVVA